MSEKEKKKLGGTDIKGKKERTKEENQVMADVIEHEENMGSTENC